MGRASSGLVLAAVVLMGSAALTWVSPVEAGGGGHRPIILASGSGFGEPTLLDLDRTQSAVTLLSMPGAAGDSVDAIALEGRPRVELWLFNMTTGVCTPPTFSYRAECANEVLAYYPETESESAVLVRRGAAFEVHPMLLVVLGDLGLPVRIELPVGVEAVAPALEVRAQPQVTRSADDRVVRAGGGLAVAIGAVLVGGAMASVVGVRVPRGRARETQPVLRVASLSGSPRA